MAYARALLGAIYDQPLEYGDDCINDQENNRIEKSSKNAIVKTNSVNLYPNPNNGNFTLSYSLKELSKAEVTIEDVTGKLIYSSVLDVNMQTRNIELSNVRNGVYFVKIMNGKEIMGVNKVIINN